MKTKKSTKSPSMGPQQIVIADRGWVFVGQTQDAGDKLLVENARVIRRWGTTKGLGELAESGPLPNTILDPLGRLVLPSRAVIGVIACKTAW